MSAPINPHWDSEYEERMEMAYWAAVDRENAEKWARDDEGGES